MSKNPRQSYTVLIVEDNPKSMRLLSDMVIAGGHGVIQAESGEQGIERARAKKPDLILMDIQMGGIDGLEAARILKNSKETSAIPVIAVTAMAMKGDQEIIMEAGFDDYIAKPVRFDILTEKVDKWLGGEKE